MNDWIRLQQQFDSLDGVTLNVTLRDGEPRHFRVVSDFHPQRAAELNRLAAHAAELLAGTPDAREWYRHVLRNCSAADVVTDEAIPATEIGDGNERLVSIEFRRIDAAGRVCGDAAGKLATASGMAAVEPLHVTAKEIERLADGTPSVKTMQNAKSLPQHVAKRGKELLYQYHEVVANWKWEPLPAEAEARKILATP